MIFLSEVNVTPLDAALSYARKGLAVFPCSHLSKKPFKNSSGSHDATTDEARIREWWTKTPTANVAIATGKASNVYVVDVDAPADEVMTRLPLTWIARTQAGGWHYIYRISESVDFDLPNTSKKDPNAVSDVCDTRGQGGYILVFPSVVENVDEKTGKKWRGAYEWHNDEPIADLPQWIVEKVRPRVAPIVPRRHYAMVRASWATKALDAECEAVRNTGEGGRNHQLNRSAFNLGQIVAGGHLSQGEVESELEHAGLACGLKAREVKRTIRSGITAGMKTPRNPAQQLVEWKPDYFHGMEITDGEVLEVSPAPVRQVVDHDAHRWELLNIVRELGGLCDSFSAWVIRGADHPQPGLTIASLLALGSVLAGRRLVYRRATSSLYAVALAPSAEGKNRPQSCLARVLDEVWPALVGANSFSSGPAFVDGVRKAVDGGVGTLLVLDEYGMQLGGMIGPRAPSHRVDLKQSLTQLSTLGVDKWSPALSMVKGGGKLELWAPCVTLLGSTTPESLHAVLTGTDVADGFVGRHVWFRSQSVLPLYQPPAGRGDDSVPLDVRAAVSVIRARHEAWHMGLTAVEGGGLDQHRLYDPQNVGETPEAEAVLLAYKMKCDEDRRQNRRPEIPKATLGRAPEFASRMALILAVLGQPEREVPTVGEMEAETAIMLAEESAKTFGESLSLHARATWDDPASQIEMVTGAIRRHGGSASRSEILRACRSLTSRQVDDVLERLALEGRGGVQREVTGGRPKEVFTLGND